MRIPSYAVDAETFVRKKYVRGVVELVTSWKWEAVEIVVVVRVFV
jgi:hypothetical protein